jgi:hypothetical protein
MKRKKTESRAPANKKMLAGLNPENLLKIVLIFFIIFQTIGYFYPLTKLTVRDYNYKDYEATFNKSQFIQEKDPLWIPDEAVYALAAGYYIKGGNPILINSEQPPLGKYIIGLSLLFFNNFYMSIFIFFVLNLIILYLLAHIVLKHVFMSLIVVNIFLLEPTFYNLSRYMPLLDIFQLFFILVAFYFFIKWTNKLKHINVNLLFCCLFLAAAVSVKFFVTGLVIYISWIVFLLFSKRFKEIIKLSVFLGGSVYLVLTLSYIKTLSNNFTIFKIFGIQRWILSYHSSKLTSFGDIWPLIFFNRWHTWWGDMAIIKDAQWWIGWPVSITVSLIFAIVSVLKKLDDEKKIVSIWVLFYCIFISLSQASSRYLTPLMPFSYILCGGFILFIIKEIKIFKKGI